MSAVIMKNYRLSARGKQCKMINLYYYEPQFLINNKAIVTGCRPLRITCWGNALSDVLAQTRSTE